MERKRDKSVLYILGYLLLPLLLSIGFGSLMVIFDLLFSAGDRLWLGLCQAVILLCYCGAVTLCASLVKQLPSYLLWLLLYFGMATLFLLSNFLFGTTTYRLTNYDYLFTGLSVVVYALTAIITKRKEKEKTSPK